jgi:hypothetical protein
MALLFEVSLGEYLTTGETSVLSSSSKVTIYAPRWSYRERGTRDARLRCNAGGRPWTETFELSKKGISEATELGYRGVFTMEETYSVERKSRQFTLPRELPHLRHLMRCHRF